MKNSYTVSKTFRESYTGGEIGWEDQSQCILCPTDSKLNLINKNTGLVVTSLNEADEKILSCCGSQGKIAIAYESEQIFVYTLTDEIWSVAVKLKCKQVQHMDFSADGKLLAVASSDSTVKVFSVVGGYCTHNFLGSRGIVGRVYFDPNPAHYILFSIDQECDIRMWDLVKKECVAVLSGHDSSVTCLAIIDGNLISSARDKVLNVWNLKSKKLEKSIAIFEEVESIFTITRETTVGKTETLLVTAGRKGVLRLWDIKEGKQLYSFDPFRKRTIDPTKAQLEESYIDYIVYLGDDHVAVANRAQMIAIVDISTKPFQTIRTIVGWNDSILDLCFLKYPKRIGANSSFLAVAANAPSLRVLNTESNSWTVIPDAHEGNILKLALSFDREWLATSSSDGVVKVWRVVHSEDQENIKFEFAAYAASHLDACSALQWSQKSNSFLISASADTTMKMWDTEPLKDWQVGQRPINMVSCCALKAHDKEVNCAKVSPNDKFLATASQDKTIKLWKITKKSPFLSDPVTFSGHKRGVWGCAFSPVDKLLASCSTDQTIKLWSLDNATCLRTLQGHSGSVLCVEFICPLGSQLLSSGADGVLKLWNIKEGECLNSFTNHDEKIWVINAVPDTQTCELVTGGADSIITYWKDNTKEIEAKKIEDQHKIVEGNQQLTNLIATRNYKEAARLAITLNHPRKLYFIFETCFQNDKPAFKPLIESLRQEDLVYTILKIRDWNTHSKTAVLSQEILYVIFTLYTPTSLAKLPLMKQALQGLIPYTERHLTHLDTTIQESFIIDFTLFEMKRY